MQLKTVKIVGMLFLMLLFVKTQAQTSDTNYRAPIIETVKKIETIFNVTIKDKSGLLKGKVLDYANWKVDYSSLDVSLTAILAPFNLIAFKDAEGNYEVREFQYHRISETKSEARLVYLSSLYNDKQTWETRKDELENCMITAFGIDKAPKTPNSKPILTKKRIYNGYSVENIALEILPGVYTTGSIYKPYPLNKKVAIMISPNGHFGDGRYNKDVQIRCAMLAKMGAMVVSFDLFAWGESSLQFPTAAHRNSIASTIQLLSGMRFIDYLSTLKYADASRVGATGGSGGGSHTMFLAALDSRVTVSVPVVMVSANHSGGCPCESGRGIHLCGNGTNNVEIAAMVAPKPQLIISDGKDWTSNVPNLEFPFVKRVYNFYGKNDVVENAHFAEEGHDYGLSKRMAMYPFMAKHLKLDLRKVQSKKGEIDESTCTIEPQENLLVFGIKGEKLPANALKNIDTLYELFGEENHKKHELKK